MRYPLRDGATSQYHILMVIIAVYAAIHRAQHYLGIIRWFTNL